MRPFSGPANPASGSRTGVRADGAAEYIEITSQETRQTHKFPSVRVKFLDKDISCHFVGRVAVLRLGSSIGRASRRTREWPLPSTRLTTRSGPRPPARLVTFVRERGSAGRLVPLRASLNMLQFGPAILFQRFPTVVQRWFICTKSH